MASSSPSSSLILLLQPPKSPASSLLHPSRLPLLLSLSRLAAATAAKSRLALARRPPPALSASITPRSRPRSLPEGSEGDGLAVVQDDPDDLEQSDYVADGVTDRGSWANEAAPQQRSTIPYDSLSLGIKESVYEVIEVKSDGTMSTKKISRRQLLKSSGLRLRDIRSVDPSLWLMNSMPSLLVRDQAILLNLGSLRAIAMHERVFVFDYNRKGGKAFLKSLLPRLSPKNINCGPSMPFELEVVEAALVSRIQRLERKLMNVEPRVAALLEVLPTRLTADVLEELRLSKQTLVELGSRAGALKQMLLDLLEDPHEIRRICIMGRNCTIRRGNDDMECSVPIEKHIAEDRMIPHLNNGPKGKEKSNILNLLQLRPY